MGSARFYAALSALLFTAVCAYLGAALSGTLSTPRTLVTLPARAERDSLYGIILRREEPVSPGRECTAEDGARLCAGSRIGPETGPLKETALFFSDTDGYEYLQPEDAAAIAPGGLDELMASRPEKKAGARLVYGFDFYYAAFYEGGADIEPGFCRLRFEGFDDICNGQIVSVSREGNRTALLLRLTRGTSDYLTLRFTGAELIQ